MDNKKTIGHLDNKVWYRFLKVFFCFVVLVSLLFLNWVIISGGVKINGINNNKTEISCYNKIFTPKSIDIKLNYDDYLSYLSNIDINGMSVISSRSIDVNGNVSYQGNFQYQSTIPGYEHYSDVTSQTIIEKCYFNPETSESLNAIPKATSSGAPPMFNIKPVFTYDYLAFFKLLILGNFIILFIFEVIRRSFYYIVLGSIKPVK